MERMSETMFIDDENVANNVFQGENVFDIVGDIVLDNVFAPTLSALENPDFHASITDAGVYFYPLTTPAFEFVDVHIKGIIPLVGFGAVVNPGQWMEIVKWMVTDGLIWKQLKQS